VSAPHPPHILERFIPLLPAYGDLTVSENFSLLVHDVCSLVAYNPVQWKHISLKQNEIIQRCNKPSLTEIVRVIYEMNAESEGANIWMCKSLANIHHAHLLEENIKPLYIFLYRDGRDVACSFKRAVVGEKHPYHIAQQWQQEQELCIALQQKLGDGRVISICYENLIRQPEKEIKRYVHSLVQNIAAHAFNITVQPKQRIRLHPVKCGRMLNAASLQIILIITGRN
jgi:hypothetical protein